MRLKYVLAILFCISSLKILPISRICLMQYNKKNVFFQLFRMPNRERSAALKPKSVINPEDIAALKEKIKKRLPREERGKCWRGCQGDQLRTDASKQRSMIPSFNYLLR